MKSLSNIIGLKIISMSQGKQISTIKDTIIDPDRGKVAFFIIAQPSDYFGARIISYDDIVGLGDFALIIPDNTVIQDVAHNSFAIELLKKEVKVVGAHMLTTKGYLIGQVTEIMIEEETGKIATCLLSTPQGKQEKVICDTVVAYGKEIVLLDQKEGKTEIVKTVKTESVEKEKKIKKTNSEKTQPGSSLKETQKVLGVDEKEMLKRKIEQLGKQDSKVNNLQEDSIVFPEGFNVFEQKQLQFLLGKTLDKDVLLENGYSMKAGEQITAELLSKIKSRNALMQITAHVTR